MKKEEKMYQEALDKLIASGVKEEAVKDREYLFSLVRPEYMIETNKLRTESEVLINKWRLKSKEDAYDRYQKELVGSVATQLFELVYMAYMMMARG